LLMLPPGKTRPTSIELSDDLLLQIETAVSVDAAPQPTEGEHNGPA